MLKYGIDTFTNELRYGPKTVYLLPASIRRKDDKAESKKLLSS